MLEELAITSLGVIEQATLELSPGLTVVTGETGAGKTMVVTALELLLGARADASLVRAGAGSAVASAVVRPVPAGADAWVDAGADELVVSRELRAEGRSRARIAGTLAPVSALAEVLGRHVEVHAQHEHVRLARSDVQRQLLDRSAGDPHARTLTRYRDAFGRWRELAERRDRLVADARERARELDRLRAEIAEIDAAALDPEADGRIDVALEVLANAEDLQLAAAEAAAALGDDGLVESATQYFGEDSPWYSERVAASRPPYDPEKAKELVEAYVNDPDRSDGRPVGAEPLMRYGCLADPTLLEISQVFSMAAAAVGFETETVTNDQATHVGQTVGTADQDPPYRGDYMVNCYRIAATGDPASTFALAFGPPDVQPQNLSNYSSPEMQRLIDELKTTVDFADRYALVEEIGLLINKHVPLTFGPATPAMIGVRDAVKNVTGWTAPDGTRGDGAAFGVTRWSEVWLED